MFGTGRGEQPRERGALNACSLRRAERLGWGPLPPWRAGLPLYPQGLSPHLYRIKIKITACLASLPSSPIFWPHTPPSWSPSVPDLSGESEGYPLTGLGLGLGAGRERPGK